MEDLTGSNFLPCDQLAELGPGLTVEVIHDALRYGEASANSCTANDPPILSGFLRWARTLRGLRDRLAAHGWRRGILLGMPTVVSPDGKVAIAVSTGDEGTGTEADARTKYRKGAAAISAIETNQLMFGGEGFDSPSDEEHNEVAAPADRATYYLLFVKVGDEIRAFTSVGHGRRWEDRGPHEPPPAATAQSHRTAAAARARRAG